MIKRKQTQYDIAHGGTFNDSFIDNGIPIVKGSDKNHSQKMETDRNLTFIKGNGENDEDTLNLTGTSNISNDLNVSCNTNIGGDTNICGATCIDCTLNVSEETCLCCTLEVDDDTTLHCNLLVDECATVCNDTLLCSDLEVCCDAKLDNDLLVCGNTCVCGTLDVDGITHLNNHVTISGDLYVCGTAHEEHSVDIFVGSDMLTLRDGNNTALASGQKSGIVINKYDGNDSVAVLADNTGTLYVGEFNTVKVFTDDDENYFEDRDLTTPTTIPDGATLYQIGETDPDTGLKEYYYVSKDDTEPIATRSSSMCDGQLTCWNADGCDIHTINSQAAGEGALLQYDVEDDCYFHLENSGKGRVLEVNKDTEKLQWSCKAECNGQLLCFDGDKFNFTPAPTANNTFLVWDAATESYKVMPLGNNGEVLTTEDLGAVKWCGIYVCDTDGTNERLIDPSTGEELTVTDKDTLLKVFNHYSSGSFYNTQDHMMWFGDSTYGFNACKGLPGPYERYAGRDYWAPVDGERVTYDEWNNVPIEVQLCMSDKLYYYERETEKSLKWSCLPGNYVFATMADYTSVASCVPNGSRVAIVNCCDYTVSEDK